MAADLKPLIVRRISEIRKTLAAKTSELARLERELERCEAVHRLLSGKDGTRAGRGMARKQIPAQWAQMLKDMPAAFTAKEFLRNAGRGASPVYIRQILSRLRKRGRIKRVAWGKYQKV